MEKKDKFVGRSQLWSQSWELSENILSPLVGVYYGCGSDIALVKWKLDHDPEMAATTSWSVVCPPA